jgi:hypothetical protein
MAQMIMDAFREFTGGVVTSGLSSRQAPITAAKGWNSYLTNVGMGSATPAKRPGFKTVNQTNGQIYAGGVKAQAEYRIAASGAFTRYHIYIGADGRIGYVASDPTGTGATTAIAAATFTGTFLPDFAQAKNLLFIVDDAARKKLRSTTLEGFGITRPASVPTLAAGAAGGMTGTFQIRVTYYNSNTGHESSASDSSASQALTAQKLSLTNIPVSADAQVTSRKIYIRNTANQTAFRLADTIANNVDTTLTVDVTTSSLTILAPNTTENDEPPSTAKFAAWFNSYMFVADDDNIYWSKKDYPESFDGEDYEPIGANDGQKITGLVGYEDVLLIFKSRSVYVLTGKSPVSWRIEPLFTDIGCVSHRSIVVAGGALWWWSEDGPVKWDGTGKPSKIAQLLLGGITINDTYRHKIQGALDINNQMVVWTYPESGETENTAMVPFNYRLDCFPSNKWDPMHVASLATVEDNTGKRWVYAGNYNGQIFRFADANNDGVIGGTTSGSWVQSGTSIATIVSTGFYTTGQGLAKRMVSVADANGQLVARREITSNTATDLTLASAITGLTDGATYYFYVGGPNFEWTTQLEDSDQPFRQKRYQYVFLKTDDNDATIGVDIYTDEDADTPQKYLTFTGTDGEKTTVSDRLAVATVGLEWQAVIRNREADKPMEIYEIAMKAELLSEKLG